jgi:hypothetical protein
MTEADYQAEIARLHRMILAIAERLAAASEVLGTLAERKDRRGIAIEPR